MTTNISFKITDIGWLKPDRKNARTHSKKQISLIAESVQDCGFAGAILANPDGVVIAGHGRLLAAKQLGMTEVPVITVAGLSEAQERRLRIADNKIALQAGWDLDLLRSELDFIEGSGLDLKLTGFSVGEIDVLRMPKLDQFEPFDPVPVDAVSQRGDIWLCEGHRIGCGDLLDGVSLKAVMADARAHVIIADSPYNTSNATHNGGGGRFRHREFAYAHGEMSREEFTRFLTDTQMLMAACCAHGAVAFMFMDHHHAGEQIAAGEVAFDRRLNIAIWVKSNPGMGSFYRSGHEMIFVYAVHEGPYQNNVELGKHGRNRSNVFQAPSVNSFGSRQNDLELHATVKPVQLIADMIMDVTSQGGIVLDGFLGSGTTLLAAERTGRLAYGLEIDAAYVDIAVTRWMDLTGRQAVLDSTGETFKEVRQRRANESTAIITSMAEGG